MPAARRRSTSSSDSDVRTYVIDTSVLLSDPHALMRFDEHEVVIPVVVVVELEAKRSHPELGYFARQALRFLDDLRVTHGRLDHPMPIGDSGGTLRVELDTPQYAVETATTADPAWTIDPHEIVVSELTKPTALPVEKQAVSR